MKPIYLQPNEAKTGFKINSDYTRARLADWFKICTNFKLVPVVADSRNGRRFLEGAIVVDYCQWQYGIDPREQGRGDQRRMLFKRDFHSVIVKDRKGFPVRVPLSTSGKVREITDKYVEWAMENGAPVPNPELYKTYRDEYGMDLRWDCFHDWLEFLGITSDSMPSAETFNQLM